MNLGCAAALAAAALLPAPVRAVSCGQTVTQSVVLDQDLACSGTALTIGADNVTLDCNGHAIRGNGSGSGVFVGYLFRNAVIKGCRIRDFANGIFFYQGNTGARVEGNEISGTQYAVLDRHNFAGTLVGNDLHDNRTALHFTNPLGLLTVKAYHNNLYANAMQVEANGPLELSHEGRGNWWGRTAGPCFAPGVDSNRQDLVDSFAFCSRDGWPALPPAAPANVRCGDELRASVALTGDLSCAGDALNIAADDVTLDCQGHSISGDGSGNGIFVRYLVKRTTIRNCRIKDFDKGIYFYQGNYDSKVLDNEISFTDYAVYSRWNLSGVVSGNTFTNATVKDIELLVPLTVSIQGNTTVRQPPVPCATVGCVNLAAAFRRDVTLVGDISGQAVLSRSGVVLDCDAHRISGNGTGIGIYVTYLVTHTTVRECDIRNFDMGLYYYQGNYYSQVLDNRISSTDYAIYSRWEFRYSAVEGNTIVDAAVQPFQVHGPLGTVFEDNAILTDREPPTVTILSPADGALLKPRDPLVVSFQAADDADAAPVVRAQLVHAGGESVDVPQGLQLLARELTPGAWSLVVVATDASGKVGRAAVAFEVSANEPPVARCRTLTAELDDQGRVAIAAADVDGGSFDPDGDALAVSIDRSGFGCSDLGLHTVTLVVADPYGETDSCQALVEVADRAAPVFAALAASPSVLWPPNHQLVPVGLSWTATDNCGAPAVRIVDVASSEPVDGLGDGDTSPDWSVAGPVGLELRAERSGKGFGRTYTVVLEAADASGNAARSAVQVFVPRDQAAKKSRR